MAIQRLLSAVRASPFWQAGKSLTESCSTKSGFGGGMDLAWYLRKYRRLTHLVRTPADCFDHYITNAAALFLSPNLAFDEYWYRHAYEDADAAVRAGKYCSGWEHYLSEGAARHYNPAFWFDERWYQRRNHEACCAVK